MIKEQKRWFDCTVPFPFLRCLKLAVSSSQGSLIWNHSYNFSLSKQMSGVITMSNEFNQDENIQDMAKDIIYVQ